MEKEKSVLIIIISILLLFQLFINMTVGKYGYNSIKYNFEAEIDQCKSALDMYNDYKFDFINYERSNTDIMAIESKNHYERCRKIINNPEHFYKGDKIGFFVKIFLLNLIGFLFSVLVPIIIYDDNIYQKRLYY